MTAATGRAAPRAAWVLGFYALTAIVFAFPLDPAKWRTHIPGNQGDALLNLWILDWAGRHAGDGWNRLWDTTMFFPHGNTLAYSESLLPVAPVHRVIAFVVRSDVLAFNIIYVAAWVLSGWLTYLLARRLTGSIGASLVAGLVFTLATPRLIHYGFLQLGFAFLIPLVFLLVINLFERCRTSTGVWLGICVAALSLSSSYYGLVTILALGIVIPVMAWLHRDSWRPVARALGAGVLVGGLLVAPVVYQYRQLQQDPHFSRDPEVAGSAHLEDFLRVSPDNYVLSELPPFEERSRPESATIEQRLFPGVVALAFGALGLVVLVRDRSRRRRTNAAHVMLALSAASGALLVLSFGEYFRDWKVPWSGIWELPGFTSIRVPARFIVVPVLALALFAAFGVAWALSRIRRPAVRVAAVVVVVGVVSAESATGLQFSRVPDDAASKAVNEELRDRSDGPVLELPIRAPEDGAAWAYLEMPRQYLSLIDGNDRVGGYSGYAPPGFGAIAGVLNSFPSPAALEQIESLGVRYVVLRMSYPGGISGLDRESLDRAGLGPYSAVQAERLVDLLPAGEVVNLGRFGEAYLLEVVGSGS